MLVKTHELDTDSGSEQVYNAMDACLTWEIFSELKKQIPSAEPAYSFELALQGPVLDMMLRGWRVDPAARELGIQSVKKDLGRLDYIGQTLANAIAPDKWRAPLNQIWTGDKKLKGEFNYNSGMQLKDIFYNHLGVHPIGTWVKGDIKYSMDRSVLEQVSNYYQARPVAECAMEIHDLVKTLQVLEKEVDDDWRMRTSYNIGGTKAARFSSSKSPTGSGDNMQNITEDLRHMFIADPGYIICAVDAEQSDSRMIGYMCGILFDDWTYLDACESGDLHTSVARMVWPKELPWTGDLKKDREIAEQDFYRHHSYRDVCKRIGHGTNFLGKPPTIARLTNVPVHLVKAFNEKYFDAFPCLPKWQAWTAEQIQRNQRLVTIHGRHRDFFDRVDADETIRKAVAFIAAAPTADNLNLGMWRIWRHMSEIQLLAQVHDAVYFQFPESLDKNKVVRKAQELLSTELTSISGRKFTVPTDPKLGYNWGNYVKADEKKGTPERNVKGLRKFKPN